MIRTIRLTVTLLMLLMINSCGKDVVSKEESLYLKAKEELNSKNYGKAKELFLELSSKYPRNREYQRLLADSYLGLGGFQLFDFLISIERLLEGSFESQSILKEAKIFVQKYFYIDLIEKKNLKNALVIYNKIGSSNSELAKEDKLKMGLVHIFLLTQTLKDLIVKIESSSHQVKNNEIEKYYKKFVGRYIVHIDEMIYHSFKAYMNFKESFSELYDLLGEIDRALYDVFGVPYVRVRGELSNMNIEKFVRLFIKFNPKIYKEIMSNVFETCDRDVAYEKIKILEETIKRDYKNHEFQSSVLKVVKEARNYIGNHEENICNTIL